MSINKKNHININAFNDEEKVKKGSFLNMTKPVVYQVKDLTEVEGCFSRVEIEAGVVIPSRCCNQKGYQG